MSIIVLICYSVITPEMLDKLMNELEYVKTYSHREEYMNHFSF